jgi:hypothetical protein
MNQWLKNSREIFLKPKNPRKFSAAIANCYSNAYTEVHVTILAYNSVLCASFLTNDMLMYWFRLSLRVSDASR